ncbi:glycoside hydrolase family 18 protein [Baudoinia panamericana UAMH 10762]|uniref:chitinase n=1 Tax=Baudoinia panamericana (strain UAMH 10762) TaxID=717646 RepID=M2NK62_BAUPA|nr:glycoside hydrolase family 18 protein [Baudoinia panamericana UAMH 10762]EMC99495.1 glycoside hydrolase family 18 protein [Baudoinia panamericana UAMH 10762]
MSSAPLPNPPPPGQGSRVILYHQTHHGPNDGPPVSLLPLLTNNTGVTHIIIAAIHVNGEPGNITLNDHHYDHERFATLYSEMAWCQASGLKVLGMVGGAAKGSFEMLDRNDPQMFETYYVPLRDMLRKHNFDGIDLDIEEAMSMDGCIRLIDRLRADFGPSFLITLAPVATGLLVGQPHLSGPAFDYHVLEAMRGHEIAWYNTQFYNGWGDANTSFWYETIIATGWKPEKVVFGLLTNPGNGGSGYVAQPHIDSVLRAMRARHPNFGGVMGWEYFNALPGDRERPWEWAAHMSRVLHSPIPALPAPQQQAPIRPYGEPAALPPAPHPYPAESVKTLQDLGFTQQQAVAALNSTGGNVEYAAGLLFQD